MAKGDVETYYEDGQWKNRRQGRSRAFGTGQTKAEVQTAGRETAIRDGVEHVIKNQDGTHRRAQHLPTQSGSPLVQRLTTHSSDPRRGRARAVVDLPPGASAVRPAAAPT